MEALRGWTPAKIMWRQGQPVVQWRQLGNLRLADPFFDDTLVRALRSSSERKLTPIDALGQLASDSPGVPLGGLIFHLSRCGSTLLSQLLAVVPSHVVLSEAPLIDELIGAAAPEELRIQWLRWLISALGQRRLGDETRLRGAAEALLRDHFHVELNGAYRHRMAATSARHAKRPDEIYQDDRAAATADGSQF